MKLCKIVGAETLESTGEDNFIDHVSKAYIPISDHKSDAECRAAAKKLGDGDYVAARLNTPFRVRIETVPKATVENIGEPKEKEKSGPVEKPIEAEAKEKTK